MTTPIALGYWDAAPNNQVGADGLENMLQCLKELLGGAPATELTISGGTLTAVGAIHTIDTEADAETDDLTNIDQTNHPESRLLLIRAAHTDRTVVCKNSAGGAGQLILNDGDFPLDDTVKCLFLERRSTAWYEIARFFGVDRATRRIYCDRELAYKAGLRVTRSGVQEIKISGGELVVHDGVQPKLLSVPSELTVGSIVMAAAGIYFAYADTPASGRNLANSNIVVSADIPVWSHSKMGWYRSSPSDQRCFASIPASGVNNIRVFTRLNREVRFAQVDVAFPHGDGFIHDDSSDGGALFSLATYCPSIEDVAALLSVRVCRAAGSTASDILMRKHGLDNAFWVGRATSITTATLCEFTQAKCPLDSLARFDFWAPDVPDHDLSGTIKCHGYEEPEW